MKISKSILQRVLRSFAATLGVFAVLLFAHPGPAAAQVVTGYYIGSPWSVSDCTSYFGAGSVCINGSVTGSVTLAGVSPTFSGTVPASQVASYTLNATGMPSISSLSDLNTSSFFGVTNGQITNSSWQGLHTAGSIYWQISTYMSDISIPAFLSNGFVDPSYGIWLNPKSIGKPCGHSGGCGIGEPIDIGSGNVFDQVQDYATAGQNPLGFSRYYNSMATPDTLAVAMGSNWRTEFDRYLHIINPSAIYGVVAERPDGQVISFSSSSGTYTSDSDVDYTLTKSGSTWTLTDPNDTVETYTASGAVATLNTIRQRNGYTRTMTYTSGKLTSVTDSYSRSLGLSYSSAGLLTGLTTPDSLSLTYGYVPSPARTG
jgi:hypothetical protein